MKINNINDIGKILIKHGWKLANYGAWPTYEKKKALVILAEVDFIAYYPDGEHQAMFAKVEHLFETLNIPYE